MPQITEAKEYLGFNEFSKDKDLWRALIAECIGTLFLVLIGCGSCLSIWIDNGDSGTIVQIAFAFGLTVATIAQAVGHISGCHINPAVTCGLLVARYITVTRALLYIVVQCIGAVAGAAILAGIAPTDRHGSLGMTTLADGVTPAQGFGLELLITFLLVLTVFGVCDEDRTDIKGSAPLAIGLSITVAHLLAVPITGSSMNPARSFGPAVVTGIWQNHWVYWAGPISGGIIAAFLYTYIFRARKLHTEEVELESYKRQNYA